MATSFSSLLHAPQEVGTPPFLSLHGELIHHLHDPEVVEGTHEKLPDSSAPVAHEEVLNAGFSDPLFLLVRPDGLHPDLLPLLLGLLRPVFQAVGLAPSSEEPGRYVKPASGPLRVDMPLPLRLRILRLHWSSFDEPFVRVIAPAGVGQGPNVLCLQVELRQT